MKIITPKKPSDLFIKAGVFGIFFIIVLIFFFIASKNVKSVETGAKILNGVTRYKGFSDKEKEDLKLRNAGFWCYKSDTSAAITFSDRIELKTNGIFWRVAINTIGLPSGNSTSFMHVSTGYLNPFCKLAANTRDSIICDVHTIKQAFVLGKDTCFGRGTGDTTWNLAANGKRFELGGRSYTAYDTAGPALARFFPEGALDIIDKPRGKAYAVGNKMVYVVKAAPRTQAAPKPTGTLGVCEDPAFGSFESFAQKTIASDMSTIKVDSLTAGAVQKTIDAYYRIFVETAMKNASDSSAGKSGNAKVVFDVFRDGKVSNAAVVKLSKKDKKLEQTILSDIAAWTFPQWKSGETSLHIEREFWF
ncbi:MAG: hypothetical protein WBM07_01310 [Chitinivibrionales bacterium]